MYCYYCGADPAPVAGYACSRCHRVQPSNEVCFLVIINAFDDMFALEAHREAEDACAGLVAWRSEPWPQ